jgi:hypothetical protein
VHKDAFDRLYRYRMRNALPTWQAALESLLRQRAPASRMDALEQIAAAVLYEGYVLWPYRRSARKNQQRWTFGGVYPRGFVERAASGDAWRLQAECLVVGPDPRVQLELRFLQVVSRRVARVSAAGELEFVDELTAGDRRILAWDEAVERRFAFPCQVRVGAGEGREPVEGGVIVREWHQLDGDLGLSIERLRDGVRRVTARLANLSDWSGLDRESAQRRGFMSAHLVLRVEHGAFISMTDPPPELRADVEACQNQGLWPVLVEDEHTMLASPIILYDFPGIAPESPGLLFDSGEIDQLLILNTLTLTDAEKAEVRATDPRAREILDRAEALSAEDLSRLHGAIREFRVLRPEEDVWVTEVDDRLLRMEQPRLESVTVNGLEVRVGSVVRLHPRGRADVFDLVLTGKLATVEAIEQDYDERVHLAVVLADDPGRDLGQARMPGHRFFFSPDEVEPVP